MFLSGFVCCKINAFADFDRLLSINLMRECLITKRNFNFIVDGIPSCLTCKPKNNPDFVRAILNRPKQLTGTKLQSKPQFIYFAVKSIRE